ncbi:MAG: SIS domain-containing protein [Trueperaceae bacterium]|nr:SIS domain-containing protein [Trueperaceae bacterium]
MAGEYTYKEIMSQPDAWQTALTDFSASLAQLDKLELESYDEILFTGCGSTYYLAMAAATLFREQGIAARGLPASEIWLYPASAYRADKSTLLVAVSRSGTTTETIRAVERFKANAKGDVLTFSCYPESTLAQLGTVNLVFPSGQEQSIAQTRAFSVLYLATIALAKHYLHQDISSASLSEAGRRLLQVYAPLAKRVGANAQLERFYFLGSGPRYGLACEVSLKMKEMTLSHSEPFHFLEFRHGPQSMVDDNTLMIGLISEENEASERAVLNEMKARGAQILALANQNADVSLDSSVDASLRNVLYLPVLQLMAFERSLSKGLNPDKPHNLTAVVVLDS